MTARKTASWPTAGTVRSRSRPHGLGRLQLRVRPAGVRQGTADGQSAGWRAGVDATPGHGRDALPQPPDGSMDRGLRPRLAEGDPASGPFNWRPRRKVPGTAASGGPHRMTTLLISRGPCHRCGGQMRESADGPQCLHCAHHHRSADHAALIAELVAERAREAAGLLARRREH